MAMRLSGLMSGMDTDTIIQQLVASRQTKVDDAVRAQTKLEWKQDAWKSLNTKLQNLQNKFISSMRFTTSYMKKTTSVSNSSVVSVITGEGAVNGVQSLKVDQLAKTGYLTGAELQKGGAKGDYTALSTLSDLGYTGGEGTIAVKAGGSTVNINVNGDTSISDVLTKLQKAGLNASFDASSQRFFVSSKNSGAAHDFSITAGDADGAKALSAFGLQTDLSQDKATLAEYTKYAGYYVAGDRGATLANMQSEIDSALASRVEGYRSRYAELADLKAAARKQIDEINTKYADEPLVEGYDYDTAIKDLEEELERASTDEEKASVSEKLQKLKTRQADAQTLAAQQTNLQSYDEEMADIQKNVTIATSTDAEGKTTYSAVATADLTAEIEDYYYGKASFANDAINNDALASAGATKVSGQDAVIYLNDAKFESNTNVFQINGLTFTALSETAAGEAVTITTQDDVDGIYDMVKDFLKQYNEVIIEMDKLYNADSAKDYEPLTDEEKEAMSESEIEKYEQKIKDALLRRDSNLSSVSSALKNVMASGVEVNGKTMFLFDFGIEKLSYFEAADNEKYAYYIDGDPDSAYTSGEADKLKSLISTDPDTVVSFFTQLSRNLYSKMSELSSSRDGYRSFGTFYDDKKMKTDYDDYTSKIKDLEEKLADYEDKWYAKFASMETAMAKMQSNMSAVTALLGG